MSWRKQEREGKGFRCRNRIGEQNKWESFAVPGVVASISSGKMPPRLKLGVGKGWAEILPAVGTGSCLV